jgi:hypothetical protein
MIALVRRNISEYLTEHQNKSDNFDAFVGFYEDMLEIMLYS